MRVRLLAPLLALTMIAPGCVSSLEDAFDPLPADPDALAYVVRADSGLAAPHPVRYDGTVGELATSGVNWTLSTDMADLLFSALEGSPPRPRSAFTLRGVDGSVEAGGRTYAFSGANLSLASESAVRLTGSIGIVSHVDARFTPGRLVLTPPLVDLHLPGQAPGLGLKFMGPVESGAVLVRFTHGAPEGFPQEGVVGRLRLAPTAGPSASAHGVGLAVAPRDSPAFAAGTSYWRLQGASVPFFIRGASHLGPDSSLALTEAHGSLDVATLTLHLEGRAKQWTRAGHPGFQAALAAAPDRSGAIPLARGHNASLWVAVTETGLAGTAVGVRPDVLDNASLRVATDLDWYATPDPHVLERLGNGLKTLFLGWFVDFRVVDFEPGETKHLLVIVEAPEDATPGLHTVRLEFKGRNAVRTLDVVVDVS